mgnify:CR=1 FL=1
MSFDQSFQSNLQRELDTMFKVENPDDLPIVKTVYDIEPLNAYTIKGHRSVIVQITQNPDLEHPFCIFKNKINGQYQIAPGASFYTQAGLIEYKDSDWDTILAGTGYVRDRSITRTWAAYILPLGIEPGVNVYIEDVIEDIKIGGFWHAIHYAEDAIGHWTGEKIEIDFDVFNERYTPLIG